MNQEFEIRNQDMENNVQQIITDVKPLINGPLRVSADNPRYFTDDSGNAVYLTGSHTWCVLQDSGALGKVPVFFDYGAYLDMLETNNHNFFRLWTFEGWCAGADITYYAPMPFKQTGPGIIPNVGLRYDLDVCSYPEKDNFNHGSAHTVHKVGDSRFFCIYRDDKHFISLAFYYFHIKLSVPRRVELREVYTLPCSENEFPAVDYNIHA